MSAPSGRNSPTRLDALEDKARTLDRSVGALNRELAELRSLLSDHAATLAGLLAERDEFPTGVDEDGDETA